MACAVVTAVTATVLVRAESAERAERRAEVLSANRARAEKACAGLLPVGHLAEFLPDDSAVRTAQYGTLLDPGQESRALVDCRLGWNDGEQVQVRVAPWSPRDEEPDGEYPEPFPYRLPDGFSGGMSEGGWDAVLRIACPKAPPGRFRLGTDLKVSVGMPVDEEDDGLPVADWAVRIADWVSERRGCGTEPLGRLERAPRAGGEETEPEDPATPRPRGTGLCAWLDPEAMGHPRRTEDEVGKWDVSGDAAFDTARGECRAVFDGHRRPKEIKGISAISASGVTARWFYQGGELHQYGDEPRSGGPELENDPEDWVPASRGEFAPAPLRGALPSLALWAESVCDGGQTFHRVAITPELGYLLEEVRGDEPEYGSGTKLDRKAREELSREVRAVLDRYLKASGGWPARAGCRNTTILGEVEEWRIAVGG
ncbi:hypothetical protein GCM10010420_06870 [Streptomyces glaucosporus]|uniref:Secreted protein n=1 Tax=Streptomyces glaucosporus TaxID=284044 RepID=A0ABP5UT14_9ACTN